MPEVQTQKIFFATGTVHSVTVFEEAGDALGIEYTNPDRFSQGRHGRHSH